MSRSLLHNFLAARVTNRYTTLLPLLALLLLQAVPTTPTQGQFVVRPPTPELGFAHALDIDGDFAFVSGGDLTPKQVHVFEHLGASWVRKPTLTVPHERVNRISISGTAAVIITGPRNYAVVFRYDGAAWLEEQILVPSNIARYVIDDVAIAGDKILITTSKENIPYCPNITYAFRHRSGEWVEEQTFSEPCPSPNRVALDGNIAVVGSGEVAVAVYRYSEQTSQWMRGEELRGQQPGEDFASTEVVIEGNVIAVGAPAAYRSPSCGTPDQVGVVYVFRDDGNSFVQEGVLCEPNSPQWSGLGWWLDMDSGVIAVGGLFQDFAGQVFTYSHDGTEWVEGPAFSPPVDRLNRPFQYLALSREWLLVSHPKQDSDDQRAYLYQLSINTGTTYDDPSTPTAYRLHANYPNPFNPSTTISYDLPRAADATLTVYDVLGRTIRELALGTQPAGSYAVNFDAAGLPSGVYFYRIEAGDYVETRRMVIVK